MAPSQNLYFYSLACSPTEEENRSRKARLWCHQPLTTSASYGYATQPTMPMVVQSACASPQDLHGHLREKVPTLPHFTALTWERPQASVAVSQGYHHRHHRQQQHHHASSVQHSSISSAPFANAGPPGVHFYFDDAHARTSPAYNPSRGS